MISHFISTKTQGIAFAIPAFFDIPTNFAIGY